MTKKIIQYYKRIEPPSSIAEKFIEKDEKSYKKFMDELFEVNLQLWETEDSIRILENKNFNDEFIQLARNVITQTIKGLKLNLKLTIFMVQKLWRKRL